MTAHSPQKSGPSMAHPALASCVVRMNTIASAIAARARAHMHLTIITYIDHTHLRGLVYKAEVVTAKVSSHTYGGGLHQFTVAMPNDGLARGHTVVGVANAVTCGGQICLRRGRCWGGEGGEGGGV